MTSPVVVGVDLGATNIRAALVSEGGDLAHVHRAEVGRAPSPEGTADLVAELVRQASGGRDVDAVGVGFAGWIRRDTGSVSVSPNMGWRDVPFGDIVRERIPARIRFVNDLKAIAWGEYRFGAGRGSESMLAAYLGSGLGSGAVVHGKLVEGAGGYAGEIGHLRLADVRHSCGCGARGCVEAIVGGHNLTTILAREAGSGNAPRILELAGAVDRVNPGHGDQAAREGDPFASALWDEVADVLARALGGVVSILNPDRLVMGGGVWHGCPELRRRAAPLVRDYAVQPSGEMVEIVDGILGDEGGIAGAGDLARVALERD